MALLAVADPPGSLKLRRWDFPYNEPNSSGSARPSRPHVHPQDRCKLLHRSLIARGASQQPTTQGAIAAHLSVSSPEQPGLEDTRESARGLGSVANSVSERFYGSLSNRQVGEEIQRLTILLNGLVRDFTVAKDRVWHLEDDRTLAHERIDRLCASFAEAGDNLTVLSDSSVQLASRMSALEKRHIVDHEALAKLEGRLELLDARLGACEDGIDGRMALLDEHLVIREARAAEEDEKRLPPSPSPSPAKGQIQEVVSHNQLQEFEAKVELLDARLTVQERNSRPDHTFAMMAARTPAATAGTIQFKDEDSVLNQQSESEASSFQRATNTEELSVADGRHSAAERLRSGEVETIISSGVTGFDSEDEDMHNVVGVWRGCQKPVSSTPSSSHPEAAGAEQSGTDASALVQDALHPLAPASSTTAAIVRTEAIADAALRASSTGGVSGIRTDQQAPQWPLEDEFVLQHPQQPHESAVLVPSVTRRRRSSKGSSAAPAGRVVPGQGLRSPSMSTIGVDSGVVGSGAVCPNSPPNALSADFCAVPE